MLVFLSLPVGNCCRVLLAGNRGKLRDERESTIRQIDTALQAYDAVRNGYNTGEKSQALSALLAECARWLQTKKGRGGGARHCGGRLNTAPCGTAGPLPPCGHAMPSMRCPGSVLPAARNRSSSTSLPVVSSKRAINTRVFIA